MSKLSNLEEVDFSDCLCRDEGSIEIVKKLVASNSPLKTLNLSGNEITPVGARAIMQLSASIPSLEKLQLGLNCYGGEFGKISALAYGDYETISLGEQRWV